MSKKKKKCCCCCCCCNNYKDEFVKGNINPNSLFYDGDPSFKGSEAEKNGGKHHKLLTMRPGRSLHLRGSWRVHIPWTEAEIYVAEEPE